MKAQITTAGLGLTCFVLGCAITLFAHGGTLEDFSTFGRTLALAGAIVLGAAVIAYAIGVNSRRP